MKSIVLDTSVIAKWFFPSETESNVALKIKEDFVKKRIIICVPVLIYYEIANILKTAVKSFRIKKTDARLAFKSFLNLEFVVYSSKQMLNLSLEEAIKVDISAYDAQYVVLAQLLNYPFYTSDKKLLLKTKSVLIRDLNDYSIG